MRSPVVVVATPAHIQESYSGRLTEVTGEKERNDG
ncbi:hypothetical protein DBW_2932 [Desulfuromonas sp. DDH964]|nr:hypothetical protein DBW_2932 [Desulfuromonas sp. DDH964]